MDSSVAQGRLKGRKPVAVIDIGSNSVRLVVYEGLVRSPTVLFNEKILCGLGKGVAKTGCLEPDSVEMALRTLRRFHAICMKPRLVMMELLCRWEVCGFRICLTIIWQKLQKLPDAISRAARFLAKTRGETFMLSGGHGEISQSSTLQSNTILFLSCTATKSKHPIWNHFFTALQRVRSTS